MRKSGWKSVEDTYDRILKLVSSEPFLKMQGLGNEVPFFICPYPAKEAVEVARMQRQLVNSLSKKTIRVLEINLYDLAVRILKDNGDWDYYLSHESAMPKEKLQEDLLHSIPQRAEQFAERGETTAHHDVFSGRIHPLSGIGGLPGSFRAVT